MDNSADRFKPLDQQLSTIRRQAGILVHVHSVLSSNLLLSQTSAF
jgi:hypothetical protein